MHHLPAPTTHPQPARGLSPVVALVFAAAGGFTLLVVFVSGFDVAYRAPEMHVAIETVAAVVGSVAAYLALGRYRMSAHLGDLLLCLSLLVLAVGSLLFSVIPAAMAGSDVGRFSTWAPLMSRLLGAVGLAVAAFARGTLPPRRRTVVGVTVAFAAVIAAIAAVTMLLAARLPVAIPPGLSPVDGGRQLVTGHPAVLTVELLATALFAAAAAGFFRRSERGDELMQTLGIAAVVGAFASLNYFLFPSLYSEWVYSGDILAFGFYLIILCAVARELNRYWRGLAATATLEERRRIARELHDGLAQELAFIAGKSRLLRDDPLAGEVVSAVDRALAESRQAIATLTRPLDDPLDVTIARAAEEVAIRFGLGLTLELQPDLAVSPAAREALRRIVREATLNAARHGGAGRVDISLRSVEEGIRVEIRDDGAGFDTTTPRGGFGLVSMRERAESLGGRLSLASAPDRGTVVAVQLR
jgi:signal transduction histidine kinase